MTDEKPIKLYIYPFGGAYVTSHAALEYDGEVINYSSRGYGVVSSDVDGCYIYEVYPSKVGIDGEKLKKAIRNRKRDVRGADYNFFTENCADQVIAVLEEAGAKDIDKTLGISIPKLDGVSSLDDWAEKHGKLVQQPTLRDISLRQYLKLATRNGDVYRNQQREDTEIIRACFEIIDNRQGYLQKIKKQKQDSRSKDFVDKMYANYDYAIGYHMSFMSKEELLRIATIRLSQYQDSPRRKKQIITVTTTVVRRLIRKDLLSEDDKKLLRSFGYSWSGSTNFIDSPSLGAKEIKKLPLHRVIQNRDEHTT